MRSILKRLLSGLLDPVVFGLLVFSAAGTLNYWQAWVFLAVSFFTTSIPGIYLLRKNPVVFQRRTRGGPTAETRSAQKVIIVGWYLTVAATVALSGLDHRFGWSAVPTAICVVGDVLVVVGLTVVMLVAVQNSYAATTVQVEEGQTLSSTGLYGLVRHPMYSGNMIIVVGIPLALGSYWGLVFLIPGVIMLALRIRDEEELLRKELDGYGAYTQMVRYRLVPHMW